jgi:pimeloyl-ACP methyl ester carboxylesterase
MAARWTLLFFHRRGYPPSPEPQGRQDFEVDAHDIAPLLGAEVHVVAHSYGVLGALIAAGRQPRNVRSLTLIEPPLFFLAPGDPEVAHLQRLGDEILTLGLQMDPARLREFLRLAGSPIEGDGPLSEEVVRGVRRAQGSRLPGEARPDLGAIKDAGVPSLVLSGDHDAAIERICDALAAELGAERDVLAGAGHFVAAAPGFTARLESFIAGAG